MAEGQENQLVQSDESRGQAQFDPAVLQAGITQALKTSLAEIRQQEALQASQRQQQEAIQAQQRQQAETPMAELLNPHLRPVMNQSQAAMDAAVFYPNTPVASEYQGQIEQVVNGYLQQGQVVPRSTVWQWIQGSQDYQAKLKERWAAEQAQSVLNAQQAMVVGAGSPTRGLPGGQRLDPRSMTPEQLKAALEGVSF